MNKTLKRTLLVTAIVVLTLAICVAAFLFTGYDADEDALMALHGTDWVTVEQSEGQVAFIPKEIEAGFIFYPGGRVEYTAYAPMMQELAHSNVLCVLVEMPMDLAVFHKDAADGIQEQFPQVEEWYIGGHSLGGVMAADYVSRHTDDFDGLVLLASYSSADLSGTDLKVLTAYGDKDGIMNMDRYEEGLEKLPAGYVEDVLEGGNHAYFGSYGDMAGDGEAFISAYVQYKATAQSICDLIKG